MFFDSKWDDLDKGQRRKAKNEYGDREGWAKAKNKAGDFQANPVEAAGDADALLSEATNTIKSTAAQDQDNAALYSGVDEYGKWGEEWNPNKTQQQVYASGEWEKGSDFHDTFKTLNKDGVSRVDDDKGWRELSFDSPPKTAADVTDLVNSWTAAGYDVRGIDFDPKKFLNSNLAVRKGSFQDPEPEPEPTPQPEPEPTPEPVPTPEPEPEPIKPPTAPIYEPTPTPAPVPTPTPAPAPTPSPVPTPPDTSWGAPPKAPVYGSPVGGNPYSSGNPGYYYGTEQEDYDKHRYNHISDMASAAMAKGLADISTWQAGASEKAQYHNNILHEIYKSMGLVS